MKNNRKKTKERLNVTLDKTVCREIEKRAKEDDRPKSYIVNKSLKKAFGMDDKKPTS